MRKWRIQCYLPRAQSLNWNGQKCAIGDTNLSVVDNPIRCKSNMPSESTICRKCYKSAESWRRIEMIVLNANVGLVRIPMDVPMQAFHKSSKWQSEADDDAVDSDNISSTNQSPCEICCCEKYRATETANHCFPACDLSKSEWRIKKWCGNGICRKHECWTTPSVIGDRSEWNHFDVRNKTYENNDVKKMLERYNHGVIGMAWDANFRYQMPRPFNVIPSELRTWTILCMEFDRWDDQTASELLPRADFDMIGVLSEDDWLGKIDWRTYNASACCVC